MKRTYEEAVEIMIDWFCEKSFSTVFNKDNGSNNEVLHRLMLINSMKANAENNQLVIENFKIELRKRLLSIPKSERGYRSTELSIDYYPNEILMDCARNSGLNTNSFPIKTFVSINSNNEVTGRYQYASGGDWFTI